MNHKFKDSITIVFDTEKFIFKAYNTQHAWLMHDNYIEVEKQDISFVVKSDISQQNLLLKYISTLEKKKEDILKEAFTKTKEIEEKIKELKLLPILES